MKLLLYYAPHSCATVPYINLKEAGAEFDVEPLNMAKREHFGPPFLKLNPKHKLPVLVIDGKPLTENVAINLWIARKFPNAGLLPDAPWEEAKAISLVAWCASGIHPAIASNVNPKKYCDMTNSEDAIRRCAQKLLEEAFTIGDGLLEGREWFFDRFGAIDSYFYWCFHRALELQFKHLDLTRFRNCTAHQERMKQRASVRAYDELERRTIEQFARAA